MSGTAALGVEGSGLGAAGVSVGLLYCYSGRWVRLECARCGAKHHAPPEMCWESAEILVGRGVVATDVGVDLHAAGVLPGIG